MRPLATWLVVGGLAVLGLFAARDALQGAPRAQESHPVARADTRAESPPGFEGPPRIDRRLRLSRALDALGAHGVLYLTNAKCRRFLLRIPSLVWTTPEGLPGPDCTRSAQSVVDQRFGIAARQLGPETIDVGSENWRMQFRGSDPAFEPDGTLSFLKNGRLYEWTGRCPPKVETTAFRGLHTLVRCERPVPGGPNRLRELVWLGQGSYAAIAGEEFYSTLVVVRDRKAKTLFRAVGVHLTSLQASPDGRYVAAWVAGTLAVFDAKTGQPKLLPPGAEEGTRAIAWSPDSRYAAVATMYALHLYPAAHAENTVTLPVRAVHVDWR
jgi:hypothetical protein